MTETVSLQKAMWRGFTMKCPNCGRGHLFGRFLKVADHCEVCSEDFTPQRADDFPAYLVIVVVGHVVVPALLWMEMAYAPPACHLTRTMRTSCLCIVHVTAVGRPHLPHMGRPRCRAAPSRSRLSLATSRSATAGSRTWWAASSGAAAAAGANRGRRRCGSGCSPQRTTRSSSCRAACTTWARPSASVRRRCSSSSCTCAGKTNKIIPTHRTA